MRRYASLDRADCSLLLAGIVLAVLVGERPIPTFGQEEKPAAKKEESKPTESPPPKNKERREKREKADELDILTRLELEERLEEEGSFRYRDVPVQDAVDAFAAQMHIQIVIDRKALDDEGIGTDKPVNVNFTKLKAARFLDVMLAELGLTWTVEDGYLLVTTPRKASEDGEVRVYQVSDLVSAATESEPGPAPMMTPGGGLGMPGMVGGSGFPGMMGTAGSGYFVPAYGSVGPAPTPYGAPSTPTQPPQYSPPSNLPPAPQYGQPNSPPQAISPAPVAAPPAPAPANPAQAVPAAPPTAPGPGGGSSGGGGFFGAFVVPPSGGPVLGSVDSLGVPSKTEPGMATTQRAILAQFGGLGGAGGGMGTSPLVATRDRTLSHGRQVDALIDIVQATIQRDSWEDAGGNGTIKYSTGGLLVIRQSASVHRELRRFFDMLREARDSEPGTVVTE